MTDIKLSFIVSISLHFLFFLSLSIVSKSSAKVYYIPIQVIGSVGIGGGSAGANSNVNNGNLGVKPSESVSKQVTKEEVLKPGDIAVGKPRITKKKITGKEGKDGKDISKTAESAPGTAGSSGTGEGTGAGSGNGVEVNAGNFPYMGYVNVLRNKVAEKWNPTPSTSSGSKKILVYFKILRSGKVENLVVKESAGVSYIDRSAIRAIMNSSPFPPLPAGFPDDSLGVYFMFELSGT
ncbi:MAG: TonB family protein [Elusimicrobia bacterium]|nr:TonB family protein [Elusimicrobiota bacterium]